MTKELDDLELKKQGLLNQVSQIDKKIFEIKDAKNKQIENQYGISRTDRDRKCKGVCSECIIPCNSCYKGICEQCSYGYKDIVQRLRVRYSEDELKIFSTKCPYAILAIMK